MVKSEMEFKLQMEQEKREIERDRELRAEEKASAEHKRKLEEVELMKKLELADAEKRDIKPSDLQASVKINGPKLPPFEEGKGNMDSYIQRFERYATARKWQKEQWGSHLSELLKGKSLDVFSRLPVEQALNFDELKKALLKRFELTEEGFRKKFKSSMPEIEETFGQFSVRIDNYLERWIEMSKTEKSYNKLKDLMLRDQFLQCCGKDLALFLKERIPRNMEEMSRLADQYAEERAMSTTYISVQPGGDKRSSPRIATGNFTGG